MLGLFTMQLDCNANYEFQIKVVQCLLNMYFLVSDRIMILYKRDVWNKLGHCLNSLCASSLPNPKEQPFCFIKSSSLNFGFHSLGNELNF